MDFLIDLLLDFYGPVPYLIVFTVLLFCGFGVPIPEDIVLFTAGVMAYYGVSNLTLMVIISFLGVMIGDSIMFFLGAKYGRRITRVGFFSKILPEERLEKVAIQLNQRGVKLLFAARFMPGLRAPIFFSAGALHVPFRKFFLYDGLAALLSVPAIVVGVYAFGDTLDRAVTVIKRIEHGILIVIFGAIVLSVIHWWWKKVRNRTERNRRKTDRPNSGTGGGVAMILMGLSAPLMLRTAQAGPETPNSQAIESWCQEVAASFVPLRWKLDPCRNVNWKVGGVSVRGRPLVYTEFGNRESKNTSLFFSMVHGDEVTPLYVAIQLVHWLTDHPSVLKDAHVVVAPLVNPDSYFAKPRTRTNARGVDINRNLLTKNWDQLALKTWKNKFKSNPRRYPGAAANSEPETMLQVELIDRFTPQKVMSMHAPLNFLDYDGPNLLTLNRFPKSYVQECLKLRKEMNAVHGTYFPGSLGNYSGRDRGIPTMTLELPSADPRKAEAYWKKFSEGLKTMIEFKMPVDQSAEGGDSPVKSST